MKPVEPYQAEELSEVRRSERTLGEVKNEKVAWFDTERISTG